MPTKYMHSSLAHGNYAFRNKNYNEAAFYYYKALRENPKIQKIISDNLARVKRKTSSSHSIHAEENTNTLAIQPDLRKLPITVMVITWDVGHNPLGRSYMLAEVLQRITRHTLLVGFQFERYGNAVWEPVREGKIPVVTIPGQNIQQLLESIDTISNRIKPDIVIACKPRLPSVALGLAIKEKWGTPLIIDIDDHELSFFKNRSEINLNDLAKMYDGALSQEYEPYNEIWTRLTQSLRIHANEIIVSNQALQNEFGGKIIPHVRDENIFDPALYNKEKLRKEFSIPQESIILLFFGTPRIHKGIDTLAWAVTQVNNPRLMLLIVGTSPDKSVTSQLEKIAPGKILYLPNQPFTRIPEVLTLADIVCLPQEEGHAISNFQLPAKAIDAVAAGIPLLVTGTPPLMQLIKHGVATKITKETLPIALANFVNKTSQGNINSHTISREKFLKHYSYAAAAIQLRELLAQQIARKDRPTSKINTQLTREIIRLTGENKNAKEAIHTGRDIVVFWKQNDSTIYGRRHDMIIKYLASRNDTRKIIVFDAPTSDYDLVKKQQDNNKSTQNRSIYINTYKKQFGLKNSPKISYYTFIYPPGKYRTNDDDISKPTIDEDYNTYIHSILNSESIDPQKSIFWIYPKNYSAPYFIDKLRPRKVVVDVVDDHRTWPGTTPTEREKLTVNYIEILKRADVAFANCEAVQNTMSAYSKNIKLIPNGCDPNTSNTQPRNCQHFEKLQKWDGKIIGFIGNLEAKIDIDLLEKIAQYFDKELLVLIGSTHANPNIIKLKKYHNVLLTGVVPYDEASAWVRKFNIGLVPHLKMKLTENMNPLKVFVYLTHNVPVVSTEVDNIDSTTEAVKIGKSHDDFIKHIRHLLNNPPLENSVFTEYVTKNSWESRFKTEIDSLLMHTS